MWVVLALASAFFLGLYDVEKKRSLSGNAVIPVLLVNTLICSLFFLPLIVLSACGAVAPGAELHVPRGDFHSHLLIVVKALIVLSSWISGYFAIKHLPLTIVGPVNATRPVMALLGALLIYGERLNLWQWGGVTVAIVSFFMLGRSGKKEGIDFSHNRWMALLVASAFMGAVSGLYDKYLMNPSGAGLDRLFVQGWYNLYQAVIMTAVLLAVWLPSHRKTGEEFRWSWHIPLISVFLTAADLLYFTALSYPDSMIAVVSMVRRSSVLVSFVFGALMFHEKNIRSKAVDLALLFVSLVLLLFGTLNA